MQTVFFDLDDTLIRGNSANLFIKYMIKRGELGWFDLAKGFYYTALYKMNRVDVEAVSRSFVSQWKGTPEEEIIGQCDNWFEETVRPVVYDDAIRVVEKHRSGGDRMVMLSASTIYACMPVSKHLGIEHYLGTRLVVENGVLTGEIEAPLCYGTGKVARAEAFLANQGDGTRLEDCVFYTDSITDLPMLEKVGDRRIVNPDRLLAREAKRRGWPVLKFTQ